MWDLFNNNVGLWSYFQRQTHHGFPSTSVNVRCFFKSACLTSISLSSGVMVSRLEKETQTTASASFNGVVFILTCCGEPHVSLDSCVRHCARKKHLLPSSDRPKKKTLLFVSHLVFRKSSVCSWHRPSVDQTGKRGKTTENFCSTEEVSSAKTTKRRFRVIDASFFHFSAMSVCTDKDF